jgi:hypothetical protein
MKLSKWHAGYLYFLGGLLAVGLGADVVFFQQGLSIRRLLGILMLYYLIHVGVIFAIQARIGLIKSQSDE